MRFSILLAIFLFSIVEGISQKRTDIKGVIAGNLLDSSDLKALSSATVLLSNADNSFSLKILTDESGSFLFPGLPAGYYSISITVAGYAGLKIDSIHVREERFDFNLPDLKLGNHTKSLEEVVIFSEKPLIESKDGNITFNASQSPLAAGSNASELLENIPLITKDPDGKLLVRGKEPKILIDDKPVELNLQQLQDLLESLPGSSIEKIEVMTNPPPQYATEQGGVINIVTRKGKVGKSGRLSLTAGTRGEARGNANFNYRKNRFALNINAGAGWNQYVGHGYSARKNIYTDSTSFFNTKNSYHNEYLRPHTRINADYSISPRQQLNLVLQFNGNDFDNRNLTEYTNLNRFSEIYKLSERNINSTGNNNNHIFSFSYTQKGKSAGEQLRLFGNTNLLYSRNDRLFHQEYLNPDHSSSGTDSTQRQFTVNKGSGFNLRVNYDKPIGKSKNYLSLGGAWLASNSNINVDASNKRKAEGDFVRSDLLSNHFIYHENIHNLRASFKKVLGGNLSFTAGMNAEYTDLEFDLLKDNENKQNDYWSFLPFGTINKIWEEKLNLTLSYRRTIRRPRINELNPTIDFSDPYNIRFGNYKLNPSLSHNFDLVAGRNTTKYFLNLGVGYNIVEDIFSQVRSLLPDAKTQVTWENISHRKEYEISTWNGITASKKMKINFSASYTYNRYSEFDKRVKKFRDGGSFTSTLNGNYNPDDKWNLTGNFTTNRFANPQGSVSWNMSMNVGVQKKFLDKKLVATINFIDPFLNQQTIRETSGTNFYLYSKNITQTRNFRMTLAYNFTKTVKKKIS